MGQLADILAQSDAMKKVERLRDVQRQVRQVSGQVVNLAASYRLVTESADAADTTALQASFDASAAQCKADIDALDVPTRAIVDQFVTAVFG